MKFTVSIAVDCHLIGCPKTTHKLKLEVVETNTDEGIIYVGLCKTGSASAIVQARSVIALENEAGKSIMLLWKHFPDVHDKMFPRRSK